MKKLIGWAVVAVAVIGFFQNPAGAANLVNSVFAGIGKAADALGTFAGAL